MQEVRQPTSDELALQRTLMASERTFMAWTRTAVSLITFGFSVPKILEYSAESSRRLLGDFGPRAFGTTLVCLGVVSLIASALQHGKLVRKTKELHQGMKFATSRLSYIVAIVLTILGAFALLDIIFRIGPI